MILIAHRGNLQGRLPERENTPAYIEAAIAAGFDVEVDVWHCGGWYLGHDAPTCATDLIFLRSPKLWVHCKNGSALQRALVEGLHCFYHTAEDFVLTSGGYIWAYPGKHAGPRSICVLPELSHQPVGDCAGVCSDYIAKYE
jgi:hypothetical protein